MGHESSFGISSPAEFLTEVVVPQYEDFLAQNSSVRHALLTTIVAYHMYEWANGESFTRDRFNGKYPDNKSVRELFDLAKRLSNGAKHFTATSPTQKVKTRKQGGFSSAFSDEFARPLMIVLDDGSETSADRLLRGLVEFWKRQELVGF